MILKSFELNKINLDIHNFILFYGKNEGAKNDEISKVINNQKNVDVTRYDEKQIFDDSEIFFNNILSRSLFDDKRITIINRATEKILKIIEELLEKNLTDISIIINSDTLEKKSKLRALFEKKKELICVPFYPDTPEILSRYAQKFFKNNNISVSQSNINLIVNRSNGDRGALKKELEKIELFLQNKKKLTT